MGIISANWPIPTLHKEFNSLFTDINKMTESWTYLYDSKTTANQQAPHYGMSFDII